MLPRGFSRLAPPPANSPGMMRTSDRSIRAPAQPRPTELNPGGPTCLGNSPLDRAVAMAGFGHVACGDRARIFWPSAPPRWGAVGPGQKTASDAAAPRSRSRVQRAPDRYIGQIHGDCLIYDITGDSPPNERSQPATKPPMRRAESQPAAPTRAARGAAGNLRRA